MFWLCKYVTCICITRKYAIHIHVTHLHTYVYMYHVYVCAMCIMCVCYLCVYNVCLQVHVLQLYVCAVCPYTSNSSCIVFAPSPFITCNPSPTKCYLHHRCQFVMYHLCSRVFARISHPYPISRPRSPSRLPLNLFTFAGSGISWGT